jgi:hypothetical protein
MTANHGRLIAKQSFMPAPLYIFLISICVLVSLLCAMDYLVWSGIRENIYGVAGGIALAGFVLWVVRRKIVCFYDDNIFIRNVFKSYAIPYDRLTIIRIEATDFQIHETNKKNKTYALEFFPRDINNINFRVFFAGTRTRANINRALEYASQRNHEMKIIYTLESIQFC